MDEGRKRVLLIASSILVARHLKELDGRSTPATEALIANAIKVAARILEKIGNNLPERERGNNRRQWCMMRSLRALAQRTTYEDISCFIVLQFAGGVFRVRSSSVDC